MKLPSGLIVGLGRAGTTWVHRALEGEPNCFTPRQKDINYFDRHYDRGLDWYASHFAESRHQATVDISHDYFFHPLAPQRILDVLPEVKVVVILRSPVTWVESVIVRETQLGLYGGSDPDQSICKNLGLVAASRYSDTISQWKGLFGGNFSVFFYEDLKANPADFFMDIAQVLGVDSPSVVNPNPVNQRAVARNRSLNGIARNAAQYLEGVGFGALTGRMKRYRIVQSLLFSGSDTEAMVLSKEMRENMYRWTADDVLRLSEIVETNVMEKWNYVNECV